MFEFVFFLTYLHTNRILTKQCTYCSENSQLIFFSLSILTSSYVTGGKTNRSQLTDLMLTSVISRVCAEIHSFCALS